MSTEEICINRRGSSLDAKTATALDFAVSVAKNRGKISDKQFAEIRSAG
jgi:hypothetical protein